MVARAASKGWVEREYVGLDWGYVGRICLECSTGIGLVGLNKVYGFAL